MTDPLRLLTAALEDRWTVEGELGHGATSIVYEARDRESGQMVAIKVLRRELAETLSAERFVREIRLTQNLDHPNIVPIVDSGIVDGLPYCVMPLMDGGTLRAALEREKQLPIDNVVEIGSRIARALDFAHSRQLIHRDVKPENILFGGGKARLADFGIARALEDAAGRTTSTGIVRGTPAYMSPEQASGERDYDGRSDIFSLGCVLYEALAGVPAYVGPTSQSVAAQRMVHEPRPVSVYRPTVGGAIEAVLARALSLAPSDRYPTAGEFADALERAALESRAATKRTAMRNARPIAIGVGIAAVAVAATLVWTAGSPFRRIYPGLDSLRIAVAAVPVVRGDTITPDGEHAVRDFAASAAMWSDARVTPLESRGERDPDAAQSHHLDRTRQLGSRWLVLLQSSDRSGSTLTDARLIDVASGKEVRQAQSVIPSNSTGAVTAFRGLAARLFGGDAEDALSPTSPVSFGTWRDYVRGRGEMQRWQLDSADVTLSRALQSGPSFSAAALRLGQIDVWRKRAMTPVVHTAIIRATQGSSRMSPRDSLVARAVLAMGDNDLPVACAAYDRLRRLDSLDVVAWLGLGDCRTRDRVVVRDPSSPSGFRFRSSYQAGVDAYLHAAQLDPATTKLFCPLNGSGILFTSANRIVLGTAAPPDTAHYAAYPAVDSRMDTVVLVPYSRSALTSTAISPLRFRDDKAIDRLVVKHREMLVHLAVAWVAATPTEPDAHETLARALELRGDIAPGAEEATSAIAALAAARRLATSPQQRLRLTAAVIRLDVKSANFGAARSLSDSLLDAVTRQSGERIVDSSSASQLASIAALVGRDDGVRYWLVNGGDAASPARTPDGIIPAQVRRELAALTSVVALRRCDSLTVSLGRSELALRRFVPPAEYDAAWSATMPRLVSLATPCDRGRAVLAVKKPSDRLTGIQQAFARGDFGAVRAQIDTLDHFRGVARPGDVSLDYTVQEAWLLAQIGDSARAFARLQQTIEALPTLGRDFLNEVEQAGAVCGALELASRLATRSQDRPLAVAWDRDRKRLCEQGARRPE